MEYHGEKTIPRVCIIGCGFAGICAATRLRRDLSFSNFVMFDMNPEIGGTWYSNGYPGASCDGPIHLYSYSYEPRHDWSHTYASQPEILKYLKQVCTKYELYDKIRLHYQVVEIRFDKTKNLWSVTYKDLNSGKETQEDFNVVIIGTGILRNPKIPEKFNQFDGPLFHTAEWNHSCNLNDKIVAVIGVGSSGIQVIPEVAKVAKQLIVYQRRACWITPKENKPYNFLAKLAFRLFPGFQSIYRLSWYRCLEKCWNALVPGTEEAETMAKLATEFREKELKGRPDLLKLQKPKDPIGCQRIMVSADYFATLKKPNVKVVQFQEMKVTGDSLIVDEKAEEKVDVIILATGFKTAEYFSPIEIWDAEGGNVLREWNIKGPSLLFGITGHKLPNLFFLWGPNTVRSNLQLCLSHVVVE